jgi:hypothetical protein
MKKITRIITIEGPDAWVDATIANSLPQGINLMGNERSIEIIQDGRICNDINTFMTPGSIDEDIKLWKYQQYEERKRRMARY